MLYRWMRMMLYDESVFVIGNQSAIWLVNNKKEIDFQMAIMSIQRTEEDLVVQQHLLTRGRL